MDCWITTYTGRRINLAAPKPEHVSVVDIAAGLSKVCRFAAQAQDFYSVAQHSVMMSRVIASTWRMWALMHDAAEAYVGDIATPIRNLCPDISAFEKRLSGTITGMLGLTPEIPQEVKQADVRMAATEARDFMFEDAALLDPLAPKRILYLPKFWVPPYRTRLEAWSHRRAMREFLQRWCDLAPGHPWTNEAEGYLAKTTI